MKIKKIDVTLNGIELYEITNSNGMQAQIITYGARIFKLFVPDRNGQLIDVVAGFTYPDFFKQENPYFNAVIGRVGNRIGGAEFELSGIKYSLFKNDGDNHLHGGNEGFDKKIWKAEITEAGLKLSRISPDGEEGYPGNLNVSVIYSLDDNNTLSISYEAESDKDTLCSLTNHAYFNLSGKWDTILDHEVYISSSKLTAVDEGLIPHGELKDIKGTAYDFSQPKKIGKDIKTDDFMLNIAKGYDFNYVLINDKKNMVASAYSEDSGIYMKVFTDRPCMQFYTGNFLDGLVGKAVYGYQSAFCMETQGYPNACNVDSFPSMVLKKGEKYKTLTKYSFEIK
ncbi:MAG: galactose mutarotase [Clostridia bacterium]|nr:galactose mutarotase [Clostridia bacterium]